MEKNTKDKKKSKLKSKNVDTVEIVPFGQSIFDYNELVSTVFSHLPILDLFNVRIVCKKWNLLAEDATIWKGVIFNTFGIFVGPEYRKIINNSSGVDLRRAVKDPVFARTLFPMDNNLGDNELRPSVFGIPESASKEALIGQLFSSKPIWRSPCLTNYKSKSNSSWLFMLPQFQRHNYPQADSLFTQLFFSVVIERMMEPKDFWDSLMERAKSEDRSKVIVIICQWIANYNWSKFAQALDPLLAQFLETATTDEKYQIEHAQYLATLNRDYDWEKHDQPFIDKMSAEQKKAFPANIKPKLLQQPIDILNIPPKEMAKQVALVEQRHFRKLSFDFFMRNDWNNEPSAQRFNKMILGLAHWILFQPTADKRYEAIVYLIKLAHELITLRCTFGALLIISGLHIAPVFRLLSLKKATKKYEREYNVVDIITRSAMGYKKLRRFQVASIGQATVPFVVIALKDLSFTEEGNANTIGDFINIDKAASILSTIGYVMQFQLVPYLFEPIEPLQQLWDHFAEATNMTEDELFMRSLTIQPRVEKENDNNAK